MSDKYQPEISVIIVCYNYGRYLIDCLNSIRQQTFKSIEIIVVDGGSDDPHTIETIENLMKERKPDLQVYRRDERQQVGNNRNFGIQKSTGKYICCIDADDLLRPSYLEKSWILLAQTHADIVSTSSKSFGEDNKVSILKKNPAIEDILDENQLNTISVFRKECWEVTGGYHDFGLAEKHIHEDWVFWMKCIAAGAKVINLNYETLFHYRVHSSGSLSKQTGLVPDFNAQKKVVNDEYQKFTDSDHLNLPPKIITEQKPRSDQHITNIIFVDCFDTQTVTYGLPEYLKVQKVKDPFILVSTKSFEDKEDSLGAELDLITNSHFDYKRSFTSIHFESFIENLIKRHNPQTATILNDSIDRNVIRKITGEIKIIEDRLPETKNAPQKKQVNIQNLPSKNLNSSGHEVWILSIRNNKGYITNTSLFDDPPNGWTVVNSNASPIDRALFTSDYHNIELSLEHGSKIEFLTHDWSGTIEVNHQSYDLYSSKSDKLIIEI